jgi:alkylation response protein AidB-like acyl-CoA dehydrogenase
MQMKLSPEQEMLQDSANRYLRDRYDFRERSRIVGSAPGYDETRWRDFADMGWLGLSFPEEFGGTGGTIFDVMLLMKTFGQSLVVEPFLSSVVLGGMTILAAGTIEQKQRILPQIASGKLQVAFGFAEPAAGYDANDVSTKANRQGNGFRLNGQKAVVLGAPSADLIIVSARSSGAQRDPQGISLFALERSAPGVNLRSYQTIDGKRAAEVILTDVYVDDDHLIGDVGGAGPVIEETMMAGRVAVVGEAIGALNGAVAQTISYLNTREQFGKKLATFQALRHRLADMYVLTREADALGNLAAQAFMTGKGADRFATICGAKAYIAEEGRSVAENAIQLHGAIAIADEYIVGHYLKTMVAVDRMFGDVEHNLDIFMKGTDAFA